MDKQLIFLLTGLGGCGKTTLFSHYIQVYGSKYSHIFLIDASSVHNIKADLQNAVRSLGPEHSQKTWEEALQYFERDESNKNWLLGFDSADDPSVPLHQFIPKSDHGTVFITSRNRDSLFLLTTPELQWELGPMTHDEGLDTLLRSAQRDTSPSQIDLTDGAELVDRLGGLALAVVQAGVYCFQRSGSTNTANSQFSFRQYLEEMDQNYGDLMKYSAPQSLDGYDKSVYQSINMSYTALPQLTRDFLHLCGYFHRSSIPLLMLESAVDNRFRQSERITPPEVSPLFEKKLADLLESHGRSTTIHLHKLVFSLKMFSLVVTSMTPNSVMLNYHTLVSAWSRDILSATQRQQYSAMATRVISTCGDEKYYLVHISLLPHIRETVVRRNDLHLNDMHSFAARLLKGGVAGEAEALLRQMHERCVREFGRGHKSTLAVLSNLAHSAMRQGRYEETAEVEREVLAGQRNGYSEDDGQLLKTELILAGSYISQERWSEAEATLLRILAVAKKRGTEDQDTLMAMNNLALVYYGQNRHREAMKLREEVLKIHKRVLGEDHPNTLASMVNLSSTYMQLNRFDDAQRLQEESLEIMKNMNGKDHPDTLTAMNNLAVTYRTRGRLADALTLGEQALDGRRRVLGRRHPDTLQTIFSVAKIYYQLDRIPEFIQLQEELRELEGGGGQWSQHLVEFLLLQ